MEYKVIVAEGINECSVAQELAERVNIAMSDGWNLQGGVSVSRTEAGIRLRYVMAQAIIKE